MFTVTGARLLALALNLAGCLSYAESTAASSGAWGACVSATGGADWCGSASMDMLAEFEVKQMIETWRNFETSAHDKIGGRSEEELRRRRLNRLLITHHSYEVQRGPNSHGCSHFAVHERPQVSFKTAKLGGASFLATTSGDELHICEIKKKEVAEPSSTNNGTEAIYLIICPRTHPGTCATVSIVLAWEQYGAFHNFDAGGGGIGGDNAGGMRGPIGLPLYSEKICETTPAASMAPMDKTVKKNKRPGWVATPATGLLGPLAEWQSRWVWRDSCGRYQLPTSAETKECFKKKYVEFIGASHLNYLSLCMLHEVMHYVGSGKAFNGVNSLEKKDMAAAELEQMRMGKYKFSAGANTLNKTYFEYIRGCGDRPQDCTGGKKLFDTAMTDYFYDSRNITLRAASTKVSTHRIALCA